MIIFGEKIGLKGIWIAGTVDVAFAISWNPCILGNVDAVSTMDDDIIVPESNNDNVEIMTSSPMAKMCNDINNEDGQQRLSPEISDRNGQETINGRQNMVIMEQLEGT